MSTQTPRATRHRRFGHKPPSSRRGLILLGGSAVLAGLLIGAVTEGLVLRVSSDLLPLSNSAAPWIVVAFIVALGASSLRRALSVAVVVLLTAIVGFYAAQATRGWAISPHQLVFWCVVATIAGPVVGAAASSVRRRHDGYRAIGSGTVGGLLVGEAIHGLRQPGFLSPHPYWTVQLGIGILLALVLTIDRSKSSWPRRVRRSVVSLSVCAAAGLITAAVYQLS